MKSKKDGYYTFRYYQNKPFEAVIFDIDYTINTYKMTVTEALSEYSSMCFYSKEDAIKFFKGCLELLGEN